MQLLVPTIFVIVLASAPGSAPADQWRSVMHDKAEPRTHMIVSRALELWPGVFLILMTPRWSAPFVQPGIKGLLHAY